MDSSVVWGSRLCRLHLCRRERTPLNECPRYDMKQCDGKAPVMQQLREDAEYPFIAIAPSSALARSGST